MAAANKKPRKKHRPLGYKANPLDRLMPESARQGLPMLMRFHTALEMMTKGEHPGVNEWRDLADCINTLQTLVDPMRLVTPEILPTVRRAEAAMAAAAIRYRAGHGFRMDGLGIVAVRECVAYIADCMAELSAAQMTEARRITQDRVNELLKREAHDVQVIAV